MQVHTCIFICKDPFYINIYDIFPAIAGPGSSLPVRADAASDGVPTGLTGHSRRAYIHATGTFYLYHIIYSTYIIYNVVYIVLLQLYKHALQLTAIEKRPDIPASAHSPKGKLSSHAAGATTDAPSKTNSNSEGAVKSNEGDEEEEASGVNVGGSRLEHRRRSFIGVQGDSNCKGELFGLENLLQFEVGKSMYFYVQYLLLI